MYSRYLPGLDGLRGCAIILVVFFHLAPFYPAESEFELFFVHAARFGWIGVDLFFVLSGFLITGILFDNKARPQLLRTFFARRFLRILPLFYCFLAIYAFVIPVFYSSAAVDAFYDVLPWHAAYLSNLKLADIGSWPTSFLGSIHIWSLAIEEQFYLIWPLVVLVVAKVSSHPRRDLMYTCLIFLCVGPVFRMLVMDSNPIAAYVLLPARMDAIFAGAVVALWLRGLPDRHRALSLLKAVMAVFGVLSIAVAIGSGSMYSYLSPVQQSAGYTLWAIFFAALVGYITISPPKIMSSFLSSAPLIGTGKISYGLYLIHFPVIKILETTMLSTLNFYFFAAIAIVISLSLAVISWFLLEKPVLELKRYFDYRGQATKACRLAAGGAQ